MATMNSGLGGASGYGENDFKSHGAEVGNNDDGSVKIDVTSVFGESGLNFFGTSYTDIYINTNGLITFECANTAYVPTGIAGLNTPAIAPFWTDIDISQGGNIYWDLDPDNGTVTITWDDAAAYQADGNNSFQVVLTDTGAGNFDVDFIYENIEYGDGGSASAQVGVTGGDGNDFILEGTGDEDELEDFETNIFDGSNEPGVFSLSVLNGLPSVFVIEGTSGDDDMQSGFVDHLGHVIGSSADNIDGGAGDDLIDGGEGDDTIEGGAGNDTIRGGGDGGHPVYTTVNHGDNLQGTVTQDAYSWSGGAGNSAVIRFNNSTGPGTGDGVADIVVVTNTDDSGTLVIGDFDVGTDKIHIQESWTHVSSYSSFGYSNYTLTYSSGDQQSFAFYHDGSTPVFINEIFSTDQPPMFSGDDDLLSGGEGSDSFIVSDGFGNDTIIGGESGSDVDVVDVTALSNAVNVVYSGSGVGALSDGFDTISFSEVEQIDLTDLNDVVDASLDQSDGIIISAQGGDDVVIGGLGGDTISGGDGNDSIDGGAGDDEIVASSGADTLVGGDGDDTMDGGADNDSLEGGAGNDVLEGGSGDDYIDGDDGADTILFEDGFGNDTILGGEGGYDFDTIDLSALTGPVTVTYSGDEAGTITDGANSITFSEIERIILTNSSDFVDATITHDGLQGDAQGINIEAGHGDDTVLGGRGGDTIDGGSGNDSIEGGYGNDTLLGVSGADTIDGGLGDDRIQGGTGDDSLQGGAGNDNVVSGSGSDTVYGSDGNNRLKGEADDDSISGSVGSDRVFGGAGDDTLDGGAGDDEMDGEAGNDQITGGEGDDAFTYSVGDGHDTITDFNAGNSGTLNDGESDNNDFVDLSGFYDHISELYADQADDGILNQSNASDSRGNNVDYSDNDNFGSGSLTFQLASAGPSSFTEENTGVVCFAAGTMILTPKGEIPVEHLRPGDMVTTRDNGPQRIQWLAMRKLDKEMLLAHPNLLPIRLAEGALGQARALVVSPQHGLVLGGNGNERLVRATHLARIKGGKIRIMRGCRHVVYVHLLFDRHQIIFANGRASESLFPGPQFLRALEPSPEHEFRTLFPDLAQAIERKSTKVWSPVHKYTRWKELSRMTDVEDLFGADVLN